MMLWYKAWRESRARFFLSVVSIAGVCVVSVLFEHDWVIASDRPLTFVEGIWRIVYKEYLRQFFDVLVLFLAVGGLLRERERGTVGFTLALPASRPRVVAIRATVGLVEVAILAFVPSFIISGLSPFTGQIYPWSQSLQFGVLWTVGGALIFVMGFLPSVMLAGEYVAPIISILVLLVYSVIADLPWVEHHVLNVHDMMSGEEMRYFQSSQSAFVGPLPWLAFGVVSMVVIGSVALAGQITEQQDF